VTGGSTRSLPFPCQNPAFDERFESIAFLAAAHHVRVDPERERRIGVPELLHHVCRALPIATRIDANVCRSLRGVMPRGSGSAARAPPPLSPPSWAPNHSPASS
jgi:hypothetical protein